LRELTFAVQRRFYIKIMSKISRILQIG